MNLLWVIRTVLEAETKIYGHKVSRTLYLRVPSRIAQDSAFPFKPGEKVIIRIEGNKLVVEKP